MMLWAGQHKAGSELLKLCDRMSYSHTAYGRALHSITGRSPVLALLGTTGD